MNINFPTSGADAPSAAHGVSGASMPMSPDQKMSNLFDQIDPSGSGSISQGQFSQAFKSMNPTPSFQAAGATAIWNKLDPNGTGTVSKQDFVNGMTAMMKQLRGHHHSASAAGAQALTTNASALDLIGSAGSTSTNSVSGVGGPGSIIDALA